jgi:hypothetical protein
MTDATRCQRWAASIGQTVVVSVREDCRHYVMQTTAHEEKLERCRVGANEQIPFACPEGCLFYEPRKVSGAGWTIRETE